jgi:Phosphoglucomutase/phosphomannomutase, alpha/beta/alpha domain I
MALKVGQGAGLAFRRGDHRHRVVIGKDTRLSSYMIEYALVAALLPSEATFSYCACSDADAAARARQVYRGSLLDGRLARKENPLYALQ